MRRLAVLGICLLALGFAPGCGDEDDVDDGPNGPGSGAPPPDMVGTWRYQSVTVNGAPANLSDVLGWVAGAVAADLSIQTNSAHVYQEVNAGGGQLWFESGFIFIDGTELDINIQQDTDGSRSDTIRYAWTLSSGVLTLELLGQATVFTLTM